MFVYYINVPINEKGVEELDTYDEEMKNVKTFELVLCQDLVQIKMRGSAS